MIAYKFTRPDGTDHKTGTVNYRAHIGKELVHPEPCVANGQPCATTKTGGYHLARTLMDAWTYGDPGSVFRCSCRKADILGEDETKVRVKALRVLSELPVHEAYGPHGKAVLKFIDSLKDIEWFANVGEPYEKPSWAEKVETVDSWSEAYSAAYSEADLSAYSTARSEAYSAARSTADLSAYSTARSEAYSEADLSAYSAAYLSARSTARSASYSEADSAAYSTARSAAYSGADSAAEIMGGITDGYFCHLMEVYRDGHYPASFDGETLVVY